MGESDLERLEALRRQGVLSDQAYWEARSRIYTPPPITAPLANPAADYSVVGEPIEVATDDGRDAPSEQRERRTGRRPRWVVLSVVALVVCLAAGGVTTWWLTRSQTDKHYVSALRKADLLSQYSTQQAAIAHAKAFCGSLAGGHRAVGYRADRVAVEYYCRSFLPGFKVVPTPAEQLDAYDADLAANGLADTFGSDAAAVAHAQNVCAKLKAGGPSQGKLVDKLGVKTYCHEFFAGFKVLRTITVHGTFTLIDSNPSVYFPSISKFGQLCEGTGGYSDIGFGTIVIVTNGAGKTLVHTTLGFGSGSIERCVFHFHFRVTEGEGDYAVAVSHRGNVDYSFADLLTGEAALSLGS